MPSFEYTALNSNGQTETGTILSGSLADAVQQLTSKGLTVDKINVASFINDPLAQMPPVGGGGQAVAAPPQQFVPSTPREVPRTDNPYEQVHETHVPEAPPVEARSYVMTGVVGPLVNKISLSQLMFFFRQFGTMISAGVPMVQTLDTLATQIRDPRFSHVIREMRDHVQAGRPISAGMQRYPEVFSPLHLSMMRAGEEGGFMPQASQQLAQYLEQEINLRNLYRKATFMPKLTIITSMVVIIGANLVIASLGSSTQIWSPLTQITTWFWLGPLLIGLFLFFRLGLANFGVRRAWDAILIKLPYIGHTLTQFSMARFGRAFGALYAGGVPVNKALLLAADACGNEELRARMYPAVNRLEEGSGITETLRRTNAFTPIVLDMIDTGERTGNIDHMLTKMAEYYEDESEVRSRNMGHVVGVVVLICVAIYVLFIVIRFYQGHYGGIMEPPAGE